MILHWVLTFLAFRAYLLEPPPRDYITKRKTQKSSKFKWGKKNGCTNSRVRIAIQFIWFSFSSVHFQYSFFKCSKFNPCQIILLEYLLKWSKKPKNANFFLNENGILLPKLFWPIVRKNCSSDREKLLKFRGWRPKICKNFEITRKIYSNSERSEQFLVTEFFVNFFLEVSQI